MTMRPEDISEEPGGDSVATPEGDNEDLPGEPLSGTEPVPIRPRGDEPHSVEPLRRALD
jgi:hypothetical protein